MSYYFGVSGDLPEVDGLAQLAWVGGTPKIDWERTRGHFGVCRQHCARELGDAKEAD